MAQSIPITLERKTFSNSNQSSNKMSINFDKDFDKPTMENKETGRKVSIDKRITIDIT